MRRDGLGRAGAGLKGVAERGNGGGGAPVAGGLDVPHGVDEGAGTLTAAGLREVRVQSVGDGVW
ncbi:hypothetical protein ADK74_36970, partial [Streptomyces decoyicus]